MSRHGRASFPRMKYLHTMVRVSDLEKSLHFYRDLLGFDATWLESQTTNELDACTDAGGNVTK